MKPPRNCFAGKISTIFWTFAGFIVLYLCWWNGLIYIDNGSEEVVDLSLMLGNIQKLQKQVEFLQKRISGVVSRTEQLSCNLQKIGSRGGFCLSSETLEVGGNWAWDLGMAKELETLMQNKHVGDFGAGLGWYGRYFQRSRRYHFPTNRETEKKHFFDNPQVQSAMSLPKKIRSWKGYDGAVYVEELTGGLVEFLDLSEPVWLPEKYDWVMSLEVGEHIPPIYENNFLDNLARHACEGIVLSWAVPNQGGHYHVNTRNASYVKMQLRSRGFKDVPAWEEQLKRVAYLPWFKETLMVFVRAEKSDDSECHFKNSKSRNYEVTTNFKSVYS